jgi:hypothetical protein
MITDKKQFEVRIELPPLLSLMLGPRVFNSTARQSKQVEDLNIPHISLILALNLPVTLLEIALPKLSFHRQRNGGDGVT